VHGQVMLDSKKEENNMKYTFNDGASASNFSQYLEDSGYEPYKTNYKTTKIT
jgi:hypothetical protein